SKIQNLKWVGRAVLALLLVLLGWQNVDFYFHRYYADVRVLDARIQKPQHYYEVQAAQSRWQAALGPRYRVFGLGPTIQTYDPATTAYLVSGQSWAALRDPGTQL